jgi:ribosome-associated protein
MEEFDWSFARSGGPGGQNVNKVASKAVLRWNVVRNASLPADVRNRFLQQQRNRITSEGDLVLSSQRYRDQERNRQDCIDKLFAMVHQAMVAPKARRATRPTAGSKRRRLDAKKHRSTLKRNRGNIGDV